jgi:hypothetical protein
LLRNSSKSGPRVLGAEGSGAHYFGVTEQSNIIKTHSKIKRGEANSHNVATFHNSQNISREFFPSSLGKRWNGLHRSSLQVPHCMPSSITASFSLSMAQWGTFLGFGLGVLLKITKGKAKGKAKGKVY